LPGGREGNGGVSYGKKEKFDDFVKGGDPRKEVLILLGRWISRGRRKKKEEIRGGSKTCRRGGKRTGSRKGKKGAGLVSWRKWVVLKGGQGDEGRGSVKANGLLKEGLVGGIKTFQERNAPEIGRGAS